MNVDRAIVGFDTALRTLAGVAVSVRERPDGKLPEFPLDDSERRHAAALMRVNHAGEVCAQALYQGQGLASGDSALEQALARAAREETEHLAWTARRIVELGGRRSALNPLWYAGSFGLGLVAGFAGRRWNLGFLAETERQVERHLADHLQRLPAADAKSRAILEQMRADERAHAATAIEAGAATLPLPVRGLMKAASRLLTRIAYYV